MNGRPVVKLKLEKSIV